MGRVAHGDYEAAAREVLEELGGGPIPSKTLVAVAKEKGLIEDGAWVYHNMLRKVRESDEFDTSQRGHVALAAPVDMPQEPEVPAEEENAPPMEEDAVEADSFPENASAEVAQVGETHN